ncbi:MAG: helix-turn-helix transcriptional regulator [Lachnospiraceae bacterium]|nr:helix-turn-helix transcriptional regulator [Lachnospiraceae bacterium]
MDYVQLGKRIRSERKKLKITMEELAESANISVAYLGQIERGDRKATLEKIVSLANCLGVTVDYLLSDFIDPENINDKYIDQLRILLHNCSTRDKKMVVNMTKLLLSYTTNK